MGAQCADSETKLAKPDLISGMITFKRLDVFATYGATFAVMLSSLGVMLISNNYLGVDQYGKFIFYLSIAGLLTSLFSVRSGESVIRLMSAKQIPRPHLQAAAFITDALLALALLLVLIPCCYLMLKSFSPDGYGGGSVFFLLAASFVMPILSGVVIGSLLFDEHFRILGVLRLISPVLRLALLPFLLLNGFDLGSLAKIYLFSSIVSCFVAWIVFFSLYGRLQFKLTLAEMRLYWSEAKKIYSSLFFKSTFTNSDSIIVGMIAGPEKVAILSTIKLLLQPINFLFNPLGKMILPKFAKYVELGKRTEVFNSIRNYSLAGSASVLIILLAVHFSDEIISGLTKVRFSDNFDVFIYVAVQALSLAIGDWWFRSFSLSFNPNYSFQIAFFSSVYIWTVCLCGSLALGFQAFLFFMCALHILRSIWFWFKLIRFRHMV